ncbi:helix-turn-helix transcriptional regulator [Chitinophaga sancti]|uniref:helix-turn-helix transcriptional regulator n=1 Tax=Chitinophaga sancti TaxID=1004 RepID=UPI003F794D9B
MEYQNDELNFLHFFDKIGYNIGEGMIHHVNLHHHKSFDFFPELVMFFAAYTVNKTFRRKTVAPTHIKDSICFFFKNVFDDTPRSKRTESPAIRAFPSTYSYTSTFRKDPRRVQVVAVIISAEYLKGFLKEDASKFQYLFDTRYDFIIEEIMTDDILRTINDIVKKEEPGNLSAFHYKLKAMELIFYLFKSLSKREQSVHQKLSHKDIQSIYKVRDKILSSLSQPASIDELKQIAGMNELKMRKIFTQIFGMGIYDYYQHFRMQEAARLLREEKLSVSEVGYQVGFENLSHFSRTFEKYIGKKPKKYSLEQ